MDWDYGFKTKIKNFIYKGIHKFIVVPYGKLGQEMVKSLEEMEKIESIKIYDNYKEGFEKISSIETVRTDEIVLLSLLNSKQEVEDELYRYVSREKVVDLFPDYKIIADKLKSSPDKNHIFEFTYQNKKIKFDLPYVGNDLIENHIAWFHDFFEEELLYYIFFVWGDGKIRDYLKDKVVLDIGANIGNHTLYFSRICNAKLVYAFEPNKIVYDILNRNIEINNAGDIVKTFNGGVGRSKGCGNISFFDTQNMGRTQICEAEKGEIEIIAIDDFIFEEKVGLIKIDVEGMELDVIKGALSTIVKYKPCIMVEVWKESGNIEKLRDILEPLGYGEEQISDTDYLFFEREFE